MEDAYWGDLVAWGLYSQQVGECLLGVQFPSVKNKAGFQNAGWGLWGKLLGSGVSVCEVLSGSWEQARLEPFQHSQPQQAGVMIQ